MAEVQWIKIIPELFDDDKIQLIENMPEGDTILVIWFKLLCFAGKKNNGGVFTLGDKKPYTAEMFATIFHRPLSTIELALDTFESFGMVEKIKGTFTIANWEKHQNVDKMDEIREYNKQKKRESRAKKKLLEQDVKDNVNDMSMTSQCVSSQCQDIEEEKDKEKELHSIIHSMREETKLKLLGGSLGQNVVLLSDEQFDDLCDNLSLDELNKYTGIVAECELSGKKFKKKSHYQAILDMVAKDRGIKTNERRKNK